MKIADPVLSSMFVKDNEKCNISHAPSTGIKKRYSILNTKCTGTIDPEGLEEI